MKLIRKKWLFLLILLVLVITTAGYIIAFELPEPQLTKKPVIYLYPTTKQKVSVNLNYDGKLLCAYPDYKSGWEVIAQPDGTLTNLEDHKTYSYLFWEGIPNKDTWNLSEGFVVKGSQTKDFLQDILPKLGLTPKEYNEFIVFWLPLMQENEYNLINFPHLEYEKLAKLTVSPKPDSIIRVFMTYKPLSEPITVNKPILKPFERKGFTVVEWGGTELE